MSSPRLAGVIVAGLLAAACLSATARPAAGGTTLSVWNADAWHPFWRSDHAPLRWTGPDSIVARALRWQRLSPGLEYATLRLACGGPTYRARLIVARLDPSQVTLSLTMDHTPADMHPAWSIDKTPPDAVLAVNAGQFTGAMPWGWVVIDGRQRLRPGRGPLSSAIAIDVDGRVRWFHGDSLPTTGVVAGFQSYPTLLSDDGRVPEPLRASGRGVNLTHPDIRLALGETRDGRLLIAMTRYDAMGEGADRLPLGPTTPEMAAIMGALGSRDAVMLDGGISAQMLLRDSARKEPLEWHGIRKVPLALIVRPRR